mmetsp:Transcript_3701/g.5674  ORF Transcript_3701/g.5674 Transcript_3701/m.5674 type:complete len:427 (+) Transcript_3701:1-1281(+)
MELYEVLKKAVTEVDKAVETKDSKVCLHLLRALPPLRRNASLSSAASLYKVLFQKDPNWGQSDQETNLGANSAEAEVFIGLLICMVLTKEKLHEACQELAQSLLDKKVTRTAQPLVAKLYYYIALSQEKRGHLDEKAFMQYYRAACLKHDTFTQATLVNIILRAYLTTKRVKQAQEFAEKTGFPESAPYPEIARHQFYLGQINAFRLNYPEAQNRLVQAQRKAPENAAEGFRRTVQKLRVVVELLMGEIPSRKTLVGYKGLEAYAELVRAVRSGEIERYNHVLTQYQSTFHEDQNLSLVARLRHIVIKAGLRKINIAYSVISLHDIAGKLGLPIEDTEFVVAKAIRDGVIEATIDHEQKLLRSKPIEDVYRTIEPQQTLQKRIAFTMDLRNDAVRAMQFPQEKKTEDKTTEEEEIVISDVEDELEF